MTDHIEIVRLSMMVDGDAEYLRRLQEGLRGQELIGNIRIVFMDDELAKIKFLNPALARALSSHCGRVS